ncbi:MAG: DNA-directed RNA polymerase subunit K [Candidatus Marsarchaeota archaeon]|jgi:DNA-directed RNA polymerase, subunit K (EC 2.7.7.6)|nr:DNA-directed RNA polymerase subunit K [Candidatus Marsarchaeota archaeon]MCL5094378.1 DNA-directed RNA polymerase subunit K [Candidatus Marsarchaeota archaeon]
MENENYTKFEKARIIGARALQLAYGAPPLIKTNDIFDPLALAEVEFKKNLIPITIIRSRNEN